MMTTTYERFMSTEAGREALRDVQKETGLSDAAIRCALDLQDGAMSGGPQFAEPAFDRDGRIVGWKEFEWHYQSLHDELGDKLTIASLIAESHTRKLRQSVQQLKRRAPRSKDALRKAKARAAGKVKPRARNPWTPEKKLAAQRKRVATATKALSALDAKLAAAPIGSTEWLELGKVHRKLAASLAMARRAAEGLARKAVDRSPN
jgi:hypothetical protein